MELSVFKSIVIVSIIIGVQTMARANNLFEAISIVESNNNDNAVGDNGKAVGRYQLWTTYVDDVNRIAKGHYSYDDRKDPVKALEMVKIYLTHYGKRYMRLTGKQPTIEVLSRIHNGGPNGFKKASTIKYWEKIRETMV